MIQQRTINGSITELYINGGRYLTEAFPTNFHTFHRQRPLVDNLTADDFKEVTEAEKAKIEAQDAQWVRPPQSFIDIWNAKCINSQKVWGRYNPNTGYFELNGLTDITYEQALEIDSAGALRTGTTATISYRNCKNIRTVLPRKSNGEMVNMPNFMGCSNIEVIPGFYAQVTTYCFSNCVKLRVVGSEGNNLTMYNINNITNPGSGDDSPFYKCESLEMVYGSIRSNNNIDVRWSPKLTLENFQWWVQKAVNTAPITITVHPDVYSKLNDPENSEWYELNQNAQERQIAFATV